MVGHHRQAVYVHAASADSAAIIAKVNSTLTKLKAAGILA